MVKGAGAGLGLVEDIDRMCDDALLSMADRTSFTTASGKRPSLSKGANIKAVLCEEVTALDKNEHQVSLFFRVAMAKREEISPAASWIAISVQDRNPVIFFQDVFCEISLLHLFENSSH